MSISPRLPIVTFLFCTLLAAATAHGELVVNGDFQTGNFTGWTVTPAASGSNIAVDNGPGPDNTFGAAFQAVGSALDRISQTITTVPGAFYTFSFFYQVANTMLPANNQFQAFFGGSLVFSNVNASPGFTTLTFNVQATSALTTIEFAGRNGPAYDFLDNVSVNAVAAATPETGSSLAILSLALGALGLVRSKLTGVVR